MLGLRDEVTEKAGSRRELRIIDEAVEGPFIPHTNLAMLGFPQVSLDSCPKIAIDGYFDVFGDGSVMILRTPGHTSGHQSLQLKLKKAGVVIQSGDLFHMREN